MFRHGGILRRFGEEEGKRQRCATFRGEKRSRFLCAFDTGIASGQLLRCAARGAAESRKPAKRKQRSDFRASPGTSHGKPGSALSLITRQISPWMGCSQSRLADIGVGFAGPEARVAARLWVKMTRRMKELAFLRSPAAGRKLTTTQVVARCESRRRGTRRGALRLRPPQDLAARRRTGSTAR